MIWRFWRTWLALLSPAAPFALVGRYGMAALVQVCGALACAFGLGMSLDVPIAQAGSYAIALYLVIFSVYSTRHARSRASATSRILTALCICLYLPSLLVVAYAISPLTLYRVPSRSMEDTIQPGDLLIVDSWAYSRTLPERGDIIIFMAPGAEPKEYVKRVVGLPDEKLSVVRHHVHIQGRAIAEPYVSVRPLAPGLLELSHVAPLTVPPGHVFVMGDNRTHSVDSRNFGAVPYSIVRGRVLRIVWPLARRKKLAVFRS